LQRITQITRIIVFIHNVGRVLMKVPQIFQLNYYQRLYDIEEGHWWAIGMRRAMTALLDKPLAGQVAANGRSLSVLDLGCGTGYLLNFLQRYPLDGEVAGIDISAHALEFCRRRGARTLALGSAVQPPFAAASFDLIICIDTLQHLSPAGADLEALQDFARLLRPGGRLYLRTNSSLGHPQLHGADPDLYRRYSRPELKALVEQAGLVVERATYLNCLPSIWAALREYLSGSGRAASAEGPGLAIQLPRSKLLNRLMLTVLTLESWLIGPLRLELPFGHSQAIVAPKEMGRR
jgi:SAM-dependent methyltransferase